MGTQSNQIVTKLVALSGILILFNYCLCFYEYFDGNYTAQKGFYDPTLRQTFLKANLMCNACNGYLLGDDLACHFNKSADCSQYRQPLNFVWQSAFYDVTKNKDYPT